MKRSGLLTLFTLFSVAIFAQSPTFSSSVAKIIYSNCTTCHRQGAIAPFTLENYKDVYANRFAILNDVQQHVMPPWGPNPSYTHFLNERRLSSDEIDQITNWVSGGAPEGTIETEPKVPAYNDNSQLINPDFSSRIQAHTVNTPDNLDDFEFFSLTSGLSIDASIKQIELVPSNKKIVHHIFVFIDSTGDFTNFVNNGGHVNGNNYISGGNLDELKLIGGWLPGGSYQTMPDAMGVMVPKGSNYIVQIHYAPGSNGQTDATQLNIIYSREKGLRNIAVAPLLDNVKNMSDGPISIPPNAIQQYHEAFQVPSDISLVSIMPHQHKIGVRMQVYALLPYSHDTVRLIDDKWDFHWQSIYTFPKLVHLPVGTWIYATGTYDNTSNNRENPNYPPKQIEMGTSTLTEMMQVFFSYLPYQKGDENISLGSINDPVIPPGLNPVSCNVFPNPIDRSHQILNLEMTPKSNYNVELYSIDGRLVGSYLQTNTTGKISISLPNLPAGLYLAKVFDDQNIVTQKFQVE